MIDSHIPLLSILSGFSVVIPILFGFISHALVKEMLAPIFYLQCLTLVIEIINWFLASSNQNNMIIFNAFTLIEFFFIIFFFKAFFDQYHKTKIHLILVIIFSFLVLYTGFISNASKSIDNLSVSIESIVFIVYSLVAFHIIMKELVYDNLLHSPFFWINSSILIYFSGNLFLFAFSNYLQKHDVKSHTQLNMIHSVFNILYYITLSIGFWKARKV